MPFTSTRTSPFATADHGERTDPKAKGLALSILLPIRGDASLMDGCLESLAAQTLPRQTWEVVAVLGRPSKEARRILEAFRERKDAPPLHILEHPTGRTPESLNTGLKAATGRFIARVDVRSRPDPDYLTRLLGELERGQAACVGGVQVIAGGSPWGRALGDWQGATLGAGGAAFRRAPSGPPRTADTVYLGAWPAWVFDDYGGFDESLPRNQDDEFAQRLRAAGETVLLSPGLRVPYRPRETWRGIWDQYLRYGFYKPRVLARYRHAWTLRCLLPPTLVAGVPVFFLPWLLVMAGASLRRGRVGFGKRIAVAAAMHFGYGLGFWAGLPTAFVGPRIPRPSDVESERRRIRRRYALRDKKAVERTSTPFQRYLSERRLDDCLRILPPRDRDRLETLRVLEIGCGRGGLLAGLKARGVAPSRMAGLDLSPERIARAQKILPEADLREGCATELPWPDRSFDLVLLPTVLSSIADDGMRAAVLAEAGRVAKRHVLVHDMRWVRPGRGLRPIDGAWLEMATGRPPLARR
ncbi:MAG TPA: glycosyltransferase, partial [Planctomycetes bacterium]|nr:glycosyltransferase [Planctomycetota bacterium]